METLSQSQERNWSGGNKALQFQISGLTDINRGPGDFFNFFFRLQDHITDPLTPILRSFQSMHFVLPRPNVWGNTVLVSTPTQTYTASNYRRLLKDLQLKDGFAMYQGVSDIVENFPSPNVPTHCLYSVGIDTPMTFITPGHFLKELRMTLRLQIGMEMKASISYLSSEVCLRWKNNDGHIFRNKIFTGAQHITIIEEKAVLREIGSIVGAPRRPVG